ncbi:hypothetical protein FQN57_004012 [Myotisia sp. PD_48]|nr:hypothetical protein FQN57_004012 [Myotisia sp. PD_48]
MEPSEVVNQKLRQTQRMKSLYKALKPKTDTILISTKYLKSFRVREAAPIDLENSSQKIGSGPRIFKPMSQETYDGLPKPEITELSFEKDRLTPDDANTTVIFHALLKHLGDPALCPDSPNRLLNFSTWDRVCRPFLRIQKDGVRPHVIVFPTHGLYLDEKPELETHYTRSEILVISQVLESRLPKAQFYYHEVIPLLMISIFNHEVRIIQAHMEADVLCLRRSPFIDLQKFDPHKFGLIIRWILSKPTGGSWYTPEPRTPKAWSDISENKILTLTPKPKPPLVHRKDLDRVRKMR